MARAPAEARKPVNVRQCTRRWRFGKQSSRCRASSLCIPWLLRSAPPAAVLRAGKSSDGRGAVSGARSMNGVTNPAALVRWPTLVVFREVTRWHRCDRVARTGSLAHRLEVLPVRVRGDGRSLAAPLFDLFADLHRPIMRPFALVCGFAPCGACCGAPLARTEARPGTVCRGSR